MQAVLDAAKHFGELPPEENWMNFESTAITGMQLIEQNQVKQCTDSILKHQNEGKAGRARKSIVLVARGRKVNFKKKTIPGWAI